jgi:hypothetical protein
MRAHVFAIEAVKTTIQQLESTVMRTLRQLNWTISAVCLLAPLVASARAQAKCVIVTQTHNGTDFFYSDGAAGTAEYKVRLSVQEWQKKTGVKKVKIGKISTKCGDWFIKYGLPHKRCIAKARVCY